MRLVSHASGSGNAGQIDERLPRAVARDPENNIAN